MSEIYDEEYFEYGLKTGKSGYENYRWLPDRIYKEVRAVINLLGINPGQSVLDFGCFIAGTKIRMADYEDKNIEDIKVGDSVITHLGNTKKVINIFKRKSKVLNLKSLYSLEWMTTDEHPFLIRRDKIIDGNRVRKIDFIEAKDIRKGDFFAIPRQKRHIRESHYFAELLGFYLAEGNMLWCHGKGSTFAGINLTFGIHENEFAERVKFLGEKLGAKSITINKRDNKNTIDVMIFGQKLANRIYKYGGQYSDKKKLLMSEIMLWCDIHKILLISSWLKGDGYRQDRIKKGSVYYGTSVSYELINDIRKLSISIGVVPSIHKKKISQKMKLQSYILAFTGTDINKLNLDGERVLYHTKKRYKSGKKYTFIPFISKKYIGNDIVYNIEVEDDHSYYANNVPVHNCAKGYWVKGLRHYGIEAFGIDTSEYALSHADLEVKKYLTKEIPEKKFDYIVSRNTLEHIKEDELEKIIRGFHSMTDVVFFTVPLIDKQTGKYIMQMLDPTHEIKWTGEQWIRFCEKCGWDVTNYYTIKGIHDKYADYPHAIGYYLLRKK